MPNSPPAADSQDAAGLLKALSLSLFADGLRIARDMIDDHVIRRAKYLSLMWGQMSTAPMTQTTMASRNHRFFTPPAQAMMTKIKA